MSHWELCKVKIKDLSELKKVALSMGLEVVEGEHDYKTKYIERVGVVMSFHTDGGSCGIVKKGDCYQIIFDPYRNSIVDIIGEDASALIQRYSEAVVLKQAAAAGGVVTKREETDEGTIIYLSLP